MVDHPAYNLPVFFLDIAKHGPEGAKLEKLGLLLDIPKVALPPGYCIERMHEFLAGDREAFLDYAIRDAEIAVKYSIEVLKFSREYIWASKAQEDDDGNGDADDL